MGETGRKSFNDTCCSHPALCICTRGVQSGAIRAAYSRVVVVLRRQLRPASMLRNASRLIVRQVKQTGLAQQRCFAETAIAPKFDWDELENTIASEDGKRELASLRSTFIDVQQKFDSLSQTSSDIDWKSYEKEVDPQVLKMFRDSFSSLDFPAYDSTSLVNEAEQKLSDIIKQADELKAYSEKRMTELEKEIKDVEAAMAHVAHATIDEELARDPATAKQIDQEISEGNFIP